MKRPEFNLSALGLLALFAVAACSSGQDDGIDVTTSWLGPLNQFERVSGKDRFGIFLKKDESPPATVRQLRIVPAEITISPRSDLNALSPDVYDQLRAAFSDALREQVGKRVPVKAESAPPESDTYELHTALTNLTVKRRTRELGPSELADLEFGFEDAAIEISFQDGSANTRRAVIIQKINGDKIVGNGVKDKLRAITIEVAAKVVEARDGINDKARQPRVPPAKNAAPAK